MPEKQIVSFLTNRTPLTEVFATQTARSEGPNGGAVHQFLSLVYASFTPRDRDRGAHRGDARARVPRQQMPAGAHCASFPCLTAPLGLIGVHDVRRSRRALPSSGAAAAGTWVSCSMTSVVGVGRASLKRVPPRRPDRCRMGSALVLTAPLEYTSWLGKGFNVPGIRPVENANCC